MANRLGIKGIDHIEFYVDDANQWANYYCTCYGMRLRAIKELGSPFQAGRRSVLVGQGRVNFMFTEAPDSMLPSAVPVIEHLHKHGPGVKDIAFRVENCAEAIGAAVSAGAERVPGEEEVYDDIPDGGPGNMRTVIKAYGDITHSFVQRTFYGQFAFGFEWAGMGIDDGDINFAMIDHVVANVESMDEWVDFYSRVFGFEQTAHFDINTGRSSLMSKVMGEKDGYIKLPINEPSSENSQIREFLREHNGPGVQHIALLTPDILRTVKEMRRNGVPFMEVPDTYYDETFLPRVGDIKEALSELKAGKILVDRDRPDGYLLQLFTHPVFGRPTLFHEVIQRRGNSDGFGEGNFKALFEAIEREQVKRGTL